MEEFMLHQFLRNMQIDSSSSEEEEEEFDNELESIKQFFFDDHEQREIILIKEFFEQQKPLNLYEMKNKSIGLRQLGNLIMRTSNGDIRHAARLYTEAITAAPIGSEALAFAHANRSLALMRLNFLESAYDDCLCALEEGYPVAMRYKIILRQAEVAKELGNLQKMKQHISELEAIKLETREIEKLEILKTALSEMETNGTLNKEKEVTIEDRKQEKSFEKPFKIVKAVGQKERSMIATKPIKKGDTIFSDHAFVFACEKPGAQICNNCADTMIVPFPCVGCSGNVVYCSWKCKQDHARVHIYECPLMKNCSNDNMADSLPLRMLLKGLPEILPYLNKKRDAQSLWSECFENKKMKNLMYIKVFRSTSGWSISEEARENLFDCMIKAEFVAVYLKNCTKFFDCLSDTAASSKEWKIFIAATILRHFGQITVWNDKSEFNIQINPLSPRVERGQLFKMYYNSCEVFKFFPTLFICNHECTPTFEKKFDGRYMKAVAIRDVKVGDEINDCYVEHTPQFSKAERQNMFMERFYFKCQCIQCEGSHKKFKEFHQFWCENSKCKKSYSAESHVAMNGDLRCPHCRKQQDFNFEQEIKLIAMLGKSVQGRSALFDRYDKMQRKFKDCNINKALLIPCLTTVYLASHFEEQPLTKLELDKLHNINLSMLEYPMKMLEKGQKFLFLSLLWDVIALRGMKIRVNDLRNSLEIVNEFEIKERTVLKNYYEDFIAPLIE